VVAEVLLQKIVFPSTSDPDVTPLYVDPDEWSDLVTTHRVTQPNGGVAHEVAVTPLRLTHRNVVPMIEGRRSIRPGEHVRISLGAYFNAFPASYWRRWTTLDGVRLRVETAGTGDVIVYRSNARGVIQVVDSRRVEGVATTEFALAFDNFIDGGWYWFDLISHSPDFRLVQGDWLAPVDTVAPEQTLSLAITTLNRRKYCLELLATIAGDPDVLEGLDSVYVVDQGTDKIRDDPRFPEIAEAMGGRLDVIDQANAGGSGGFSRGMLETIAAGRSDYVMLMDDDVMVEPEGIRRALAFARLTRSPMIVGGHMFDMYDKTKLHAFAESIDEWNFLWGPITPSRHDFDSSNLRQTDWIHQRLDVAYNGWWMSLIPLRVIDRIGLSLPVFIKWDDAEFSLRARDHGFPTVSLPGAAVWHVSWVDKDDSRDWQAFYHARNRLIAALLHSPHDGGGRLPLANLASDVRHLLSMDYYTVRLRQLAYESVLAGPETLHPEMLARLGSIRKLAAEYPESALVKDLTSFAHFPLTTKVEPHAPRPRGRELLRFLVRNLLRHGFRAPRTGPAGPASHLPSSAPWWHLPAHDSVAITNAEGSGVTWHRRDPARFRELLLASIRNNLTYRLKWRRLRTTYRDQLASITSQELWRRTLGIDREDAPRR